MPDPVKRPLRRPSATTVLSGSALAAWAIWVSTGPSRDRLRQRREGAAIAHRIRGVLARSEVRVVFQPIISTDSGRLVGAEALSRFETAGVVQQPPDEVFADAATVGLGVELELLAVRLALQAATALPADLYVSVNVSPAALQSSLLLEALPSSQVPLERLVLEVTEHVSVPDYDLLTARADQVRQLGVRLAVDDAGAGFASFRHILRLGPEYIKLDRTLIENISEDPARRALAAAVVLFAGEMGSAVVAEGVETVAELRTAQTLGIDAAQGFLLGRPTDDWATWAEWHARGPLYRFHVVA